jgi:aminoglycoside phosphotransferase (APT) family kinase protein
MIEAESTINRFFGDVSFEVLDGGISKKSYRVDSSKYSIPVVATVLTNPDDLWKMGKDVAISSYLAQYSVPHAKVLDTQIIETESCNKVGLLIREFIEGQDMDSLLTNVQLSSQEWKELNQSLGTVLGDIHRISLSSFGLIKDEGKIGSVKQDMHSFPDWVSYYDQMMADTEDTLKTVPIKRIGVVSRDDLILAFSDVKSSYLENRSHLYAVDEPRLTHNDSRFANFIVAQDIGVNLPQIMGVIDFEWALAGDPDIDLIQIENWLNFADYTPHFLTYADYFKQAYLDKRKPANNYQEKRKIYHMYRSIEYLMAMFGQENTRFNEKNIGYVEKHFDLLTGILCGKNPENSLF